MNKSLIIILILILCSCVFQPSAGHDIVPSVSDNSSSYNHETGQVKIISKSQYQIQQHLTISNQGERYPEKQNLWIALIRDLQPYQQVISRKISPDHYSIVIDEYENQYVEFDLSNHAPGTFVDISIEYQVQINEINYPLKKCYGELPDEFLEPELHIEASNPQIIKLTKELSDAETVCEQVRNYYNYIGNELTYSENNRDWGAQAALGYMGADCTEYSSLMIAMSRAAGIPSRYYEGILYIENSNNRDNVKEHAWLDVYLPGNGWVAMDPTLGRSSLNRDKYFAHYTADHIVVTTGRNPSTLRGANYWSHLYWPGNSTIIKVTENSWQIKLLDTD